MDLLNETGLEAGWCLAFGKTGRETLVVAVKATYVLPTDRGTPQLAAEQQPLTKADQFRGEPGLSATLRESDYAQHKPKCDVLVIGSAHAPHGRARSVRVGLRVGPIRKRFEVVGERRWRRFLFWVVRGRPARFASQPISYDLAYGGADASEKKPDRVRSFVENPVGVGFYPFSRGSALVGKPLPSTQEIRRAATRRKGRYRPMSFGPLGRNFKSRAAFAGTFDQRWMDHRAPYLPDDFDERYFQCAPADQQMPYPRGGEEVVLENLTPEGVRRFALPAWDVPVLVVPHEGEAVELAPVVDTVVIEPEESRFTLTARATLPLRRSVFELARVVIGKTAAQHRRESDEPEKDRYASLDELIRAQRGRAR